MSDTFRIVSTFADRLQSARINYRLEIVRSGWIMFCISVPGERWEVEFNVEGETAVEVFSSESGVQDHGKLEELFERFSDPS